MVKPSVFVNWHSAKLDSYTPTEAGIQELQFFADYIAERWLSSPRERHSPVANSFKTLEAGLHFNGAEKEFKIASFLKHRT